MLSNIRYPFLLFFSFLIVSCSGTPEKDWIQTVPEKTPFVILNQEGASLENIVDSNFAPFLDDITGSAISLITQVDSTDNNKLSVKAILMYPGASNDLHPIWVTTAPENYDQQLGALFYQQFAQNQYSFNEVTIRNLHVQDRNIFAAQLGETLYLSESSQGIEDVIRTYKNMSPAADFTDLELTTPSILLNTPFLDHWVEQMGQVLYRPMIKGAFEGSNPTVLQTSTEETDNYEALKFTGSFLLKNQDQRSTLIASLSHENAPLELDAYISSNASAFGIFRLPPRMAPPSSLPDSSVSTLDSLLVEDDQQYRNLAESLDNPFALVMYSESGFLTTGEHLFLRKLSDREAFEQQLEELENDDHIELQDDIYFIQSTIFAELIGSEMATFGNFYLDITDDVVVVSKRRGLAEIVASDRNRRRVMSYEQEYTQIKETLPSEIAGFAIANEDLASFIDPFLAPENYVDVLLSQFNIAKLHTELDDSSEELTLDVTTYQTDQQDQPYRENWMFPLDEAELTGQPVLADIGGSSREEVIFATDNGTIYALASDGTDVLEVSTDSETPVGSPALYDWYGTGQNVILVGAGDKVYGWNDTGEELPNFPFELPDDITTPLVIHDLNRNGLPNIIVGTADRNLHVLDGRGDNIDGWPQSTNAPITDKPLVDNFQGTLSVIAFAENAIHAWDSEGDLRSDFPKFLDAGLNGSPILHNENILAGAADGYLYSVGDNTLFADSLNALSNTTDTSGVEGVYIANSSLMGTPSIHQNVTVETDEETYTEPMILTMSSNGSIFLVNEEGILRYTESMGQPSSDTFSPVITDIDSNDESDVVALADFGRLYAWQLIDGERLLGLPTTGMEYPIIANFDGDDYQELIAQTNNGLRSWTIYPDPSEDQEEDDDNDEDSDNEESN